MYFLRIILYLLFLFGDGVFVLPIMVKFTNDFFMLVNINSLVV